jgi:hypothetical protein
VRDGGITAGDLVERRSARAVFATVAYEDLNGLHRQSVQAAEALAEDEKRLLVSTD